MKEIPEQAQRELARAHDAVEAAITARDETHAALSRFDAAIADARERMTADEQGFRDNVREIIREALGAGDEKLFDRIKTRVRKLFSGKSAPVGPDPRIATILSEESAGARLALVALLAEAEQGLEQATLEHDRVRLDVLAGGIAELLDRLAPLVIGRADLLAQRKAQTDNGDLVPAVPFIDGRVAEALARLTAESQWVNSNTWGEARFAQSRARLAELGYATQTTEPQETAA